MLIQSHEGYIHVLPALPEEWENGEFKGLCARGGFTVSAKWRKGKIFEISVTAKTDGVLKMLLGESGEFIESPAEAGKTYLWNFEK